MSKIYLKKQWLLRKINNQIFLTSETEHNPIDISYEDILTRLKDGIDFNDISDHDFLLIEQLNNSNFLSTSTSDLSSTIELSKVNFDYIQQQINHITFDIIDLSKEQYLETFRNTLLEIGFKEDKLNPKIILVISNTYTNIPKSDKVILPIIVGRVKCGIGPVLFPWNEHVSDMVETANHYPPELNYNLPSFYKELELGWLKTSLIQFLTFSHVKYVNKFVEFNMANQELNKWPILLKLKN